jgi:hypothetical protein
VLDALYTQIVFYVSSTGVPPLLGRTSIIFIFRVRAANNQPAVKMVVPDYHSTASSSTQLTSQHPLRQHFRERVGGGTDLSTVLPTPLNHRHHLLSPVRTETPSHGYTLRATPERIEHEGCQGDGFGRAVAGGDGGVAGTVAGSGGDVTGSGGGRVGGRGVATGVMQDVARQERLQQELLVVMLGG